MGLALDAAIVVLSLLGALFGFLRGLYGEIARIVVVVLAILCGLLLRDTGAWALRHWGGVPTLLASLLGFPVAALAVGIFVSIVAKIVEVILDLGKPSFAMRFAGAVAGGIRGSLLGIVVAVIFAAIPLPTDPFAKSGAVSLLRSTGIATASSVAGPYAANLAALSRAVESPERFQALVASPEIQALAQSPAIRSALENPELHQLLSDRDIAGAMKNPAFEQLLRDPQILEQLRGLDLEKILSQMPPAQ